MFEEASKLKLRWETASGVLSVEDLWDLPLTHSRKANLDAIARKLNKELKEEAEESFVVTKSTFSKILNLKFDFVKHIIAVKLQLQADKEASAANKAQDQRILEILARKEEADLENKSPEELRAMLSSRSSDTLQA